MSTEENKALIHLTQEEILNKGNLDLIDQMFAADYVLHLTQGDRRGRDALKQTLATLRTAFPDLHVRVDHLVAEADRVAWQRTHRGTHQSEYRGIPATGKNVMWRAMLISRIVDGRIVEEWALSDLAEQLR
jgi:steroid delta-isomerase-like uncharacterized protein